MRLQRRTAQHVTIGARNRGRLHGPARMPTEVSGKVPPDAVAGELARAGLRPTPLVGPTGR